MELGVPSGGGGSPPALQLGEDSPGPPPAHVQGLEGRRLYSGTLLYHHASDCFTPVVLMSWPYIYKACTLDRVVLVQSPILFVWV